MVDLAKAMPEHGWQKVVAGFGELGLAIIVGETGTKIKLEDGTVEIKGLDTFATKERVWKRLGLAVIDGERQQKRTNVEEAEAHGYNPRRRAEIWAIADSMFKHQRAGDKDEDGNDPTKSGKPMVVPAHATGPYGEVYGRRKAHTETRGWTDKHRDHDARRIMMKALVEDLWRVSRGLSPLCGEVDRQ